MVLIDAVNPDINPNINSTGVANPLYVFGRVSCEFGVTRFLVSIGALNRQLDIMNLLPSNISSIYLKNIYKCPYTQVLVNEAINIPLIFKQTSETGLLGSLPLVVINADKGINQSALANLSTNSILITIPNQDHYVQFYPRNAPLISNEIFQMINNLNYTQ